MFFYAIYRPVGLLPYLRAVNNYRFEEYIIIYSHNIKHQCLKKPEIDAHFKSFSQFDDSSFVLF